MAVFGKKKTSLYTTYSSPLDTASLIDISYPDGFGGFDTVKISVDSFTSEVGVGSGTLAQTLSNGNTTGGTDISISAEDRIVFNDTGTNKEFVSNGTASILMDGSIVDISADGSNLAQGYITIANNLCSMAFGTTGGLVEVDASNAFMRVNNINKIQANSTGIGFNDATIDTLNTSHFKNTSRLQDALPTNTAVIDLDTFPITDGAYKTLQAGNTNITLNATTAYSTTNSARWTLEFTQDATVSRTLTLGTNFLTEGGAGITVSAALGATDTLHFETDSNGQHRLISHTKAYA